MISEISDNSNTADSESQAIGCVCSQAGFCERHQCLKTKHWHMLCQTRADYFQLWEEGRGPGQQRNEEPSLLSKAANVGKAVVKHVANGRKVTTDEVYAARLDICNHCESLDPKRRVCQEKSCGCFVDRKARWASENCPRGKWSACAETDVAKTESSRTSTEMTFPSEGE